VVAWTSSAGTLASANSTTNAAGIASNTVTTSTAGAVQVSASSPLATAPAVFALNGALASLGGLSEPQREVAKAVDAACPALASLGTPTPAQRDLLDRCRELIGAAGIDPAATIAALDQLMADVALTQVNAAFSAAQSQFLNLKTRIAALRSGTGGTDFGGLAINTSMGPVSLGTLASAFSNSAAEAGTEVGTDFSRWGFFAAGTIGRGEADAGSVNPAYDFDVEGVTAGLDYRKSDKWIIGGSFGYTRQDTQLPGDRGGLDTTGWSVSAYTTYYQADSWYMDGVLTYGQNDYELLRRISYTLPLAGGGSTSVNQEALADSGGDLLSTAFTVGRDWNFGAFGVGPYARVLYTRLGFDDIDEELLPGIAGSGLGLRIENRDITSLASVLGAKFTYTHSASWGVLMPHLQLEWEHEYKDDPQALEARFINDPTGSAMLVSGDPLDTNYFRIGLGLSMVLTQGRSGFFYYERLAGMNGMSQDNLALGFRMEF
jgi:outer membrane autotransporter protein